MDLTRRWPAVGLVAAILALAVAGLGSAWREPPAVWAASGAGATTWYFAEGYTGSGFDEYLTILNPNPEFPADIRVTYYLNAAAPVIKTLTVGATRRATVAVHDPAQGVGRDREVAAKVESVNGVGIVAERPIYFTYNGSMGAVTGGHDVLGATAPSQTWHFAEGYTGAGFDQYLTILNPNPTQADVAITYYLRSGAPIVKSLMVGPAARRTVAVHESALGVGRGQEVSATVTTTNPGGIVAERPIYFSYAAGVDGGHAVLGAASPATTWYFAEGYTGAGFDQYLTILNPGSGPASVRVTYYLPSGGAQVRTLTVAPAARATVAVHDAGQGVGRGLAVAAKVESTNGVGIVVERPMYFAYGGGVDGGHIVMGATAPQTAWLFAEGYTGDGFDEYLTVLNPNAGPASIQVTYYLSGGGPIVRALTVGPNARATVAVHDSGQGVGRGQAVAARVESTNGVGIVAERPVYFRYGSVDGGHVALGFPTTAAPAPAPTSTPTPAPTGLDAEEQAFLTLLNQYRQANGRSALTLNPTLTSAAKWMSQDLAANRYFSHTDSLGRNPSVRAAAFGYTGGVGENIAGGYQTASAVLAAWQASPGHNQNLLGSGYRSIGIGRAYDATAPYRWYWTTNFGNG